MPPMVHSVADQYRGARLANDVTVVSSARPLVRIRSSSSQVAAAMRTPSVHA